MGRQTARIALAIALGISVSSCEPRRRADRAGFSAQVRQEFLHAWRGYRQYAWGHDALLPLSNGYRDWYDQSLLMTPLDAFDTMLLMDLHDEAADVKALIFDQLSFDRDISVQVFEIVIRSLGALITAYQLDGDERFLDLAVDLGDRLLPAYESATGMPYGKVNLRTGAREWQTSNPAEIGTQMLEFGMLSELTGDPVYYDKAKRAVEAVFERRSAIGLVGSTIDVETGEWQDTRSHISARIDSYYEYLLKSWLVFRDDDFKTMWDTSIAAVNRYLADSVTTGFWYGHAEMNVGERIETRFGALDAFMPAVLALSGDLARAEMLMESCFKMWTTHGIEPEQLDYMTMEPIHKGYPLRPETIESAYYLYQITGDEKYLDMGETMFQNIVRFTRTESGFAALSDVTTKTKADDMESFFLAETLKYAFLLFAPDETLDFDAVVFNTEAHPIFKNRGTDLEN